MVEQENVDFCFVEIAMVIALFLVEIRLSLSSCIALSCAVFTGPARQDRPVLDHMVGVVDN